MGKNVVEFRGIDNLVYAEVLTDSVDGITFGPVKPLVPVAELSKTTSSDSATKYYDNQPMINVKSTGPDEVTVTCAVLDLETLAELTGQDFDKELQMIMDGENTSKEFAIGYRTKDTGGQYRYIWRLKGNFSTPDEASATEDDGTDSKNQELKYTGVSTIHKFLKDGKSRKSINVQQNDKVDLTSWFTTVQTPDTVKVKASAPASL
ncbi:MAG: hypothetical protein RR842_10390 [Gordonibacter sp.]|uniref:major tail protein n=1 Tax=Gordonibacter sp. TaxID=1968902 RepID=UPI002FCC5736